MAPPVYTIALLAGSATPGSALSFEPPGGHRYVMVDIVSIAYGTNNDASFATVDVNGLVILQWALPPNYSPNLLWRGRAAFDPGDVVQFSASTHLATWNIWVTGYDLSLP
jgi:hypothetical protein